MFCRFQTSNGFQTQLSTSPILSSSPYHRQKLKVTFPITTVSNSSIFSVLGTEVELCKKVSLNNVSFLNYDKLIDCVTSLRITQNINYQ